MVTFKELYKRLVQASMVGKSEEEIEECLKLEYDPHHLDCLLNPQKHNIVWKIDDCCCSRETVSKGSVICPLKEGLPNPGEKLNEDCIKCLDETSAKDFLSSKDIIPALKAIDKTKGPVYALIAPAFLGQFSEDVTPGKLRNAFKQIGFDGMIEVALFADILTLKEALEFDRNIHNKDDFHLTSCCCPMWIAMIRKKYKELVPHVPGSVSPMIACGRVIKKLHPEALTVFIGPCVAKKAEAREPEVAGAIDFVLTFKEVQAIFNFVGINPADMRENIKDHSSRAGRIYARTGGVSEAVRSTLYRLNPNRGLSIKTQQANGVAECKNMLNNLLNGEIKANFFEGMGCSGGCVGGPKAIINSDEGRRNVNEYGKQATYPTPIDNPYVIELLHRLGFDTVESLLKDKELFTRDF